MMASISQNDKRAGPEFRALVITNAIILLFTPSAEFAEFQVSPYSIHPFIRSSAGLSYWIPHVKTNLFPTYFSLFFFWNNQNLKH